MHSSELFIIIATLLFLASQIAISIRYQPSVEIMDKKTRKHGIKGMIYAIISLGVWIACWYLWNLYR